MSGKRLKPAPPRRHRSWRAKELEECEREYRNGNNDRLPLAHAIAICANTGIAMPNWAAAAYLAGYKNLLNYHADSWESIFGPAIPKGHQLRALRKRHQKSHKVLLEIERRRRAGAPIDDELFAAVGSDLDIGTTLVKEYYKHEKRVMKALEDKILLQWEKDENELRTWIKRDLAAARRAIETQKLDRAKSIIEAVNARLAHYYGPNTPTQ